MAYEKLSPAEEMKLMIIENFIDYFYSDDSQRERAKEVAAEYVINDHVNELAELLSNDRIIEKW